MAASVDPILDALWPDEELAPPDVREAELFPAPPIEAIERDEPPSKLVPAPRWFHDLKKKAPKDMERSAVYHAMTPEPNYSEMTQFFTPELVDRKGREYVLDETWEAGRGERQRFWFRIPIRLRGRVNPPDAVGQHLELYRVLDQTLLRGITDGVFITGSEKRTGHLFLTNIVQSAQVADPSGFESWLNVSEERGGPL